MSAAASSVDEIDLADKQSFQSILDFLVSIRILRLILSEKKFSQLGEAFIAIT